MTRKRTYDVCQDEEALREVARLTALGNAIRLGLQELAKQIKLADRKIRGDA